MRPSKVPRYRVSHLKFLFGTDRKDRRRIRAMVCVSARPVSSRTPASAAAAPHGPVGTRILRRFAAEMNLRGVADRVLPLRPALTPPLAILSSPLALLS
jgi:hypothetical protein